MIGKKEDSLGKIWSNAEKRWFPWGASRIIKGKPVFFPGCNLVNFLPDTARKTIEIVRSCGGGWLYDCCGKPLSYSNDHDGVSAISQRIHRVLEAAQVPELITACPNCLNQFRKTSAIPVKDIYTYLKEEGVACESMGTELALFQPCPDRGRGELVESISGWTGANVVPQEGLPCCGLAIRNQERAREAVETIRSTGGRLSTCCASCTGHLSRNGVSLEAHVLSAGLGVVESPAKGAALVLNRMRPLFWK